MSVSPREAYRDECNAVAATDPRWSKVAGFDDCIVCGGSTHWRFKGKPKDTSCHDWLKDPDADSVPMLPCPVYLRPLGDTAILTCENCGDKGLPSYEWLWAGGKSSKVKKLALGAHCTACKRWIRWVSAMTYGPYAGLKPPVKLEPEEEYLFEGVEEEREVKTNFFEVVGEGKIKKQGKEQLPPPPVKNRAITPMERAVLCTRLYEKGERLYLDADGKICCTNWDNLPDEVTYGLKASAVKLKKAMIEDIFWQLRACEVSPHVLHVHPQDRVRNEYVVAWENGDRKHLTDEAPGISINEVVAMEIETLGHSPTAHRLEKEERCVDHNEAVAVVVETGGLF